MILDDKLIKQWLVTAFHTICDGIGSTETLFLYTFVNQGFDNFSINQFVSTCCAGNGNGSCTLPCQCLLWFVNFPMPKRTPDG